MYRDIDRNLYGSRRLTGANIVNTSIESQDLTIFRSVKDYTNQWHTC